MNGLAFEEFDQGKKFDANFISVYNKDKDEYDYYVQRLIGVQIDNEEFPKSGKLWVCYINQRREDWSFLCDNNRIVSKDDDILWRLEKYVSKDELLVRGQLQMIDEGAERGPDSGGNPSTHALNSRTGEEK